MSCNVPKDIQLKKIDKLMHVYYVSPKYFICVHFFYNIKFAKLTNYFSKAKLNKL